MLGVCFRYYDGPTIRITGPAPVTFGLKPRHDRGVRGIRLFAHSFIPNRFRIVLCSMMYS